MRASIKLLSLTVWMTVWLLVIAATLVILGIFNEQLNWDIFSPQVEQVLYGVFFSCIILSAFGVAITFVLGLKRVVEAIEALQYRGNLDAAIVPRTKRLTYVGYMMGLFVAFAALIGTLELIDYRIQEHRSQVFKQVAATEVQKLSSRIAQPLSRLEPASSRTVPRSVSDLISALGSLTFVQNLTLYVPDPQDPLALWRYSNYQVNAEGKPFFERFLPAREFEKAIDQALKGNTTALETLNQRTNLIWYYTIQDEQNQPIAVLRIEGNQSENFREYTSEPTYQQN